MENNNNFKGGLPMNLVKYTVTLALLGSLSSTAFGMEKKHSGDDLIQNEEGKRQRVEITQEQTAENKLAAEMMPLPSSPRSNFPRQTVSCK